MAENRSRVALRLPPDLTRRLRLAAALQGRSANYLLTEIAGRVLPTEAELADQLRQTEGKPDDQR